jgi:broad specificity phosphatase PhoE
MALVYLVQHAEKRPEPGDPGLTDLGRDQASRVAQWLSTKGIQAVYSSPLRRAVETAEPIAAALGVAIIRDERLVERMNWDGRQPLAEFLADWERATLDRDFVPSTGDSSRRAAARLIGFLEHLGDHTVAAVTHGGITIDALRTLGGDAPVRQLLDGVPPCAVTTLDGTTATEIAATDHLRP